MKTKQIILVLFWSTLSTLIFGQSLDSLLIKAYQNNPELRAIQLEYEAALQKAPQVSQLPYPTIGIGVPVLRPETRLGGQVLGISASQMFPWFGTLKTKEDVMLTMAKTKYERLAAARLNIDYQIKTGYYYLYLLQAKQDVIRKNIRIFETIEKVALAKVESGKSIASDVLAVQIQLEQFYSQIQILDEQKQGYSASLNEALNNPLQTIISIDNSKIKIADLAYDLDQYKRNISSNHPLIKQIDWNIEASHKKLELNNKMGKPTIGLGIDYSLVNERTDAFPIDNGQDIFIPKVMISIPIYRNQYAAKKEEEILNQQAFELQKEQLTNNLVGKIQQYKSDFESAKFMYDLAHRQIELSNSSYDILLAEYGSSGRRFDELMKLQSDINRYEIEILNAVIETHLAKFKIERLTDF